MFISPITDIDECSNSTLNDCDTQATCANTPGSFTCICNSGYMGNGTSCTGDYVHIIWSTLDVLHIEIEMLHAPVTKWNEKLG